MAFNPENRITWEELAPSLQELFKNLQSQITREVERARNEELRLDRKIDDEIARAKSEEQRIEAKLDAEIDRSTQEDQDIHDELDEMKEQLEELTQPPQDGDGNMEWQSGNGWVKFPNGVIMQCGIAGVNSTGGSTTIPWNIPYSSHCFGVYMMHMGSNPVAYCIYGPGAGIGNPIGITNNNCVVKAIAVGVPDNYLDPAVPYWVTYWFSIGV